MTGSHVFAHACLALVDAEAQVPVVLSGLDGIGENARSGTFVTRTAIRLTGVAAADVRSFDFLWWGGGNIAGMHSHPKLAFAAFRA